MKVAYYAGGLIFWFAYFTMIDWLFMKIQGLNYFIGIFG